MNLIEARKIAVAACYRLQPYAEKINIAGSIRRQKPEVKDIEIVCTPQWDEIEAPNLFGEVTLSKTVSRGFIQAFHALGEVVKGKPDGRYAQIKLPEGIMLDLFMPEPSDYYRQYAIRTGSAEYAQYVIAHSWRVNGWVGTDKGLRKESQCVKKEQPSGKPLWKCEHPNPTLPPVWSDEREFFKWLGVMYREPKDRVM